LIGKCLGNSDLAVLLITTIPHADVSNVLRSPDPSARGQLPDNDG